MMNNNFIITEAKFFAERLRREAGNDVKAQVDRAYGLALGRAPSEFEREKAMEFIRSSPSGRHDVLVAGRAAREEHDPRFAA